MSGNRKIYLANAQGNDEKRVLEMQIYRLGNKRRYLQIIHKNISARAPATTRALAGEEICEKVSPAATHDSEIPKLVNY